MIEPKPKGHILMVVVTHSRRLDFDVPLSLFEAVANLKMQGWDVGLAKHIGDADLAGARNMVFSQAYKGPFTHLLFVDADVSWEPGSIERMLSWNVDLILGAYPKRADNAGYPVRTKPGVRNFVDPITREPRPDGLMLVDGGPTGLMLISRACMDRMVNEYEDHWYEDARVPGRKAWNIFVFAVRNNKRVTEDMYFCERWRAMGGEVWVDPHLMLHHHGDKTYSGRFADFVAQVIEFEKKQAETTVSMADLLT